PESGSSRRPTPLQLLCNCADELLFISYFQRDCANEERQALKLNAAEILQVLLCGDQPFAASSFRRCFYFTNFRCCVSVMVAKCSLACNVKPPPLQIEKKSIWIADSTECEIVAALTHLDCGNQPSAFSKLSKT